MIKKIKQHKNHDAVFFLIANNEEEFDTIKYWLHLCQIGYHEIAGEYAGGNQNKSVAAYVSNTEKTNQIVNFIKFWNICHCKRESYLVIDKYGKVDHLVFKGKKSHNPDMEETNKVVDLPAINQYFSEVFPNYQVKEISDSHMPQYGSVCGAMHCQRWEKLYKERGLPAFLDWEEEREQNTGSVEDLIASF